MLTLRFGAEEGREAELEKHLRHAIAAAADRHRVRSSACISPSRTTREADIETTERGDRKVDGIPNWLVMIEAATPEAADEACDKLLAADPVKHGAHAEMERGLYSLQYCRMKTPGRA